MKAHTDLEQSRILSKILPLKSADMYWYLATKSDPKAMFNEGYKEYSYFEFPCWSLAALLEVIKDDIKIEKTLFDQSDMFTYSILGDGYAYRTYEHEELVDACYEMIIKLKEKDLI